MFFLLLTQLTITILIDVAAVFNLRALWNFQDVAKPDFIRIYGGFFWVFLCFSRIHWVVVGRALHF